MGALNPILFFVLVYGISLCLAIFVCRTVYYSINGAEETTSSSLAQTQLTDAKSIQITALK
jgi:hypothetical protein